VQLHKVLEQLSLSDETKETIAKLPVLHGGIAIIGKIPYLSKNRLAAEAAAKLEEVYQALTESGVHEHIVIDMGVLRGLDYYTGVVFEGYSPELGYGLVGGGRYDNLIEQFGFQTPAVGFAVGLERLALVMPVPPSDRRRCIVGGLSFTNMQAQAEELRLLGCIAELDLEGLSQAELIEKWEQQEVEIFFTD
jgi:ATP phosphoribosyltransferase regulatory subunit